MMKILKSFILLLLFMLNLPVFAGPVEEALSKNEKVFLYLYTPTCGACRQFNAFYANYVRKYSSKYKFVKVNASTPYGIYIANQVQLQYVPWVVLLDSKKGRQQYLQWDCIVDDSCSSKILENF